MKKIKIGETEYEQAETAEDLSIKRFTDLKHYIIYKETGVAAPNLIETIRGFIQGFDNESKSEMLITLHNYFTGLQQINDGGDPDQMMFALITFEKDEDRTKFDETLAKDKLKRWNEQGLTQKTVEESVTNFIQASSAHFVTSLRTSLMMQTSEE
jgi:hypothetical protein